MVGLGVNQWGGVALRAPTSPSVTPAKAGAQANAFLLSMKRAAKSRSAEWVPWEVVGRAFALQRVLATSVTPAKARAQANAFLLSMKLAKRRMGAMGGYR